jgi:hypothetical protein
MEQTSRDRVAEVYAARREIQRLQTKVMILQAELDDRQQASAMGGNASADGRTHGDSGIQPHVQHGDASVGGADSADSDSGSSGPAPAVVAAQPLLYSHQRSAGLATVHHGDAVTEGGRGTASVLVTASSGGPSPARSVALPVPSIAPLHPYTSHSHSRTAAGQRESTTREVDAGVLAPGHKGGRTSDTAHSAGALIRRFVNEPLVGAAGSATVGFDALLSPYNLNSDTDSTSSLPSDLVQSSSWPAHGRQAGGSRQQQSEPQRLPSRSRQHSSGMSSDTTSSLPSLPTTAAPSASTARMDGPHRHEEEAGVRRPSHRQDVQASARDAAASYLSSSDDYQLPNHHRVDSVASSEIEDEEEVDLDLSLATRPFTRR